jgi:hypothetical protein
MLRQPSALLVGEVRRGEASSWTTSLDGSMPTKPRRRPGHTAGSACCPISTSTSSRVSAGNVCTRTATTATRRRGRPCRRGHGGDGDTDRGRRDSRPARLSQRTTRSEHRCRTSVLVALSSSRRSVSTCAITPLAGNRPRQIHDLRSSITHDRTSMPAQPKCVSGNVR